MLFSVRHGRDMVVLGIKAGYTVHPYSTDLSKNLPEFDSPEAGKTHRTLPCNCLPGLR